MIYSLDDQSICSQLRHFRNTCREIVFDVETTGLEPVEHRIIEVGAVELIGHVPTERTFHTYINPEREIDAAAEAVHGLSQDFLEGQPVFADIAADLLEFIGDSQLVIHNAPFDMGFLNAELARLGKPEIAMTQATDTLIMARKRYPGAPASLDALCQRFEIDLSARQKHGALLDSLLLADVYLELLGGRQTTSWRPMLGRFLL